MKRLNCLTIQCRLLLVVVMLPALGFAQYRNMVVSAHPEASRIGKEVMLAGGNAFDAAVALQFALAVCLPAAGNIGGGGFAVYHHAKSGSGAIDYRETAPSFAHPKMYLDSLGKVIPGKSTHGITSAGIPGTVAGMEELHKKFGKLPWKKLVLPAAQLAQSGVVLTPKESALLNRNRAFFRQINARATAYDPDQNTVWKAGDTLKLPELAKVLFQIAEQGAQAFYQGPIARQLCQFTGWKTEDLAAYRPKFRIPVQGRFRDYKLISMPPPSSGGIGLVQILEMLEPWLAKHPEYKPGIPAWTHLLVEAERRFYADRSRWLGDPDFYQVPQAGLLDSTYAAARFKDFDEYRATPSTQINPGKPAGKAEKEETTHYSIADQNGNLVSVTTTLNGAYGSYAVVPGLGFILNNEMDDFSISPGVPNVYGLVGGKANQVEAGKRMLSTMTPTLIFKQDKPWMVVGSPGGSTILTSVLQTFLNVAVGGMNMQEAVNYPRFHHQWLPDRIKYEEGCFNDFHKQYLIRMGHQFDPIGNPIGRVDAILIDRQGNMQGGADPRGDDTAIGW